MIDNALPMVGKLLQRRYNDERRAWVDAVANTLPHLTPWPKRRSSKRRPVPGLWPADNDVG